MACLLLRPEAALARCDDGQMPDASATRPMLSLLSDGKGHFIALVTLSTLLAKKKQLEFVEWDFCPLYSSDGKTFHALRGPGGRAIAGGFDVEFWDPRVAVTGGPTTGEIFVSKAQTFVRCETKNTPFVFLPDTEAKAMLAEADFRLPLWDRREYALARDDEGIYYYVDQPADARNKSFRLFRGPKGALVELKLKNVTSDSAGDLFATDKGSLGVSLESGKAFWEAAPRRLRTRLTMVPVEDNRPLIYNDLGVYLGSPLGTPCDDLR